MRLNNSFLVAVMALGLVGCGGGGGGGGSSTLSPFVNWSSVAAGTSVSISGDSQEATYSFDVATRTVTGLSFSAPSSGATFTATYDAQGEATNFSLTSARGTSLSFSRAAGDTFGYLIMNPKITVAISRDGTNTFFGANPLAYGFEYQSFGIWGTGSGTGSGTIGNLSVGAQTSGSAVPSSGTATYSGITGGRYVDGTGSPFYTSSLMSASANFSSRSLSFSTSGTEVTADLVTSSSAAALNMTGSLSYSAGSNQFSGSVSTTSGLSGTATGRFYGPSAQEIGGSFLVNGAGGEGYAGGFGASR